MTIQLFNQDIYLDFDEFIVKNHLDVYISIGDLIADNMVWYLIKYIFSDSLTGNHALYLHDYMLTVADDMASYITDHLDDICDKINEHYMVDNLTVTPIENDDIRLDITLNTQWDVDALLQL